MQQHLIFVALLFLPPKQIFPKAEKKAISQHFCMVYRQLSVSGKQIDFGREKMFVGRQGCEV